MSDKIILKNMIFFGRHGVYEHEGIYGQKFAVDVELRVSLAAAGQKDDLTQTVNYVEIYEKIREIVEQKKFALIEAVAENIAHEVLKDSLIDSVLVRVRKPGVSLPHIDYAEVEIERGKCE